MIDEYESSVESMLQHLNLQLLYDQDLRHQFSMFADTRRGADAVHALPTRDHQHFCHATISAAAWYDRDFRYPLIIYHGHGK